MTMHDVATNTYPVGILCDHCMHRVVVSAHDLKAHAGDRRTLVEAGVYCGRCGSTRFEATLFHAPSGPMRFMRAM
jgi:DNA-directed RNA polymerase subunit RPC12/RpoP